MQRRDSTKKGSGNYEKLLISAHKPGMPRVRRHEAVLIVAILSVLAIWWVWAALDPLPVIEDEASYVLQSRIFASGHWTAPTPPAPEFFQQPHVLTIPAVASKYPPGHALLMAPGSWFDTPALVPLLLTGLSGALLFALVWRVANAWVALFAWIAWIGDPINLQFRPSYLSEVTTAALWLVGWWALLHWRSGRQRRWLLALAAAIGWGAITRPLTMLAFAIPIGVLVVRDVAREHLWRDLAFALALGTAMLCVIPFWSARTTGSWRLTPEQLYAHDYLPYDKPGFTVDRTPPALPLSPVNNYTYVGFFGEHVHHTPARLPAIALDQLTVVAHDEWSGARLVLVPFVLLGLTAMSAEIAFVLSCVLTLFVAYLSYAHWSHWTLYYFEGLPVLSLIAALGIWKALGHLRSGRRAPLVAACLLAALSAHELRLWHRSHAVNAAAHVALHQLLNKLPIKTVVVFVHYAPRLGTSRQHRRQLPAPRRRSDLDRPRPRLARQRSSCDSAASEFLSPSMKTTNGSRSTDICSRRRRAADPTSPMAHGAAGRGGGANRQYDRHILTIISCRPILD